ncbi:B3 domain-containing protein [Pyrus ussuriensis x Pyrus communis]|uniref:B3 domain-containing protein n=1 Tax=Pyrus ussuriensis x Pyrus communis TaxID=2448454 RepID=A0A5N5HCJ3_9ROSA|nr:B3 domain-containing protein [Pyrus ussuriensis x Pyrus communis]
MEDEASTYQVSTALTLCDPTWNYDTNKGKQLESDPASLPPKLPKRDDMSARKMKENQLLPQPEEPWKINNLSLPKKWIIDNVRPYLGDKLFERVQSGMGLQVRVHDRATNTMHYVNFTCWYR